MTDFLQLAGKTVLVMGVANRKSVAWQTAQVLNEAGADVVVSGGVSSLADLQRAAEAGLSGAIV